MLPSQSVESLDPPRILNFQNRATFSDLRPFFPRKVTIFRSNVGDLLWPTIACATARTNATPAKMWSRGGRAPRNFQRSNRPIFSVPGPKITRKIRNFRSTADITGGRFLIRPRASSLLFPTCSVESVDHFRNLNF